MIYPTAVVFQQKKLNFSYVLFVWCNQKSKMSTRSKKCLLCSKNNTFSWNILIRSQHILRLNSVNWRYRNDTRSSNQLFFIQRFIAITALCIHKKTIYLTDYICWATLNNKDYLQLVCSTLMYYSKLWKIRKERRLHCIQNIGKRQLALCKQRWQHFSH